jgi:tetratricopeptide (TPR) repeat protein
VVPGSAAQPPAAATAPGAPPVSPFKPTVPVLSSLKALAMKGPHDAASKPTASGLPGQPLSLQPQTAAGPQTPAKAPLAPSPAAVALASRPTPFANVPAAAPAAKPAPPGAHVGPAAAARPGDATPSDFPPALGSLEETDLPVVSPGLPVGKPQVPFAARPGAPARQPGPSAAKPQAQPPGKPGVVAYRAPSPAPPPPAAGALDDLDFDLPEIAADLPARKPMVTPRTAPAVAKGPPAAKPPAAVKAAPVAKTPATPAPAPTFELDLPDPAADLPVRAPFGADLPATRGFNADLPAARGPLAPDLPAAREAALPVVARPADLPVARATAAEASAAGILGDLPEIAAHGRAALDAGLPVIAAGLPLKSDGRANLPAPAASLPASVDPRAHLPATQASLPIRSEGNLPSPAATLPIPLDSLPVPASSRAFGEIELPTFGEPVPPSAPPSSASSRSSGAFGLFGEIDLPHESPPSSPRQPSAPIASAPPVDMADFADLKFEEHRSVRPPPQSLTPPVLRSDAPKLAGGMSFGEVDIGGGSGEATIGLDASDHLGRDSAREAPIGIAAASAPARGKIDASAGAGRKRSIGKMVGVGLALIVAVAGGALQMTPYGAFGYIAIDDAVHANDYRQATLAAITETDKAAARDTYDAAKAALEAVYTAQARAPRARALAAYTAFADWATTARFGIDTTRTSRAEPIMAAVPTDSPVQYRDAAMAARAAAGDNIEKARKGVDAASGSASPSDPIQHDLALLSGELALVARDAPGAVASFKRALASGADARAHFGLARAYDLAGDAANEKLEIAATLAGSPGHPGALTLRARPRTGVVDAGQALADLAVVIEGASRGKASPSELSQAYAAKAWVSLERGGATDARDAFAQAVSLDPRNVDALNGQGRLFLYEDRATEALARFDTALGIDPNSVETIANDAEAKIALERLADAKQQLALARTRFPKSIPVLILLGKVEQHLGNMDAAEADLRAAIALVDPSRPDAVLPYVALSKLLAERGHVADARAALDEAKKKLTPSPALERAFGEMSELQGDYDGAIAHYNAAVAQDPKDAKTHFRLGVALRRIRKFEPAAAELDRVAAVDKDYPGLSLERGLLFQESGDVQKAIEQFNGALAKAPDDPDLQLRVGAAYVAIGRPDEALPMLHKVLEKRPQSAEAQHYIGRALMLQPSGQSDAIRYLKRAVDLDPNRAEFHVYLAWAANDATPAQLELARDEIDKALALDNMSPEAYWQRGVLERMEGADEDALKDENHALALRPSRYEAHATLAQCFEDKNQEANALAEWARAIAGDQEAPDATTVRHPFWRFRYGKLLGEHGGPAAALVQLLPAVTTAEAMSPKPGWLAPLEFLTAQALHKTGKRNEAVDHYKRFLEIAPVNSPDRLDAQQALAVLAPR